MRLLRCPVLCLMVILGFSATHHVSAQIDTILMSKPTERSLVQLAYVGDSVALFAINHGSPPSQYLYHSNDGGATWDSLAVPGITFTSNHFANRLELTGLKGADSVVQWTPSGGIRTSSAYDDGLPDSLWPILHMNHPTVQGRAYLQCLSHNDTVPRHYLFTRDNIDADWEEIILPEHTRSRNRMVSMEPDYAAPDRMWLRLSVSSMDIGVVPPTEYWYSDNKGDSWEPYQHWIPRLIGLFEPDHGFDYESFSGRQGDAILVNMFTRVSKELMWTERIREQAEQHIDLNTRRLSFSGNGYGTPGVFIDMFVDVTDKKRMIIRTDAHTVDVDPDSSISFYAVTFDGGETWSMMKDPERTKQGEFFNSVNPFPVVSASNIGLIPRSWSSNNQEQAAERFTCVERIILSPTSHVWEGASGAFTPRVFPLPAHTNVVHLTIPEGAEARSITCSSLTGSMQGLTFTQVGTVIDCDIASLLPGVYALVIDLGEKNLTTAIVVLDH